MLHLTRLERPNPNVDESKQVTITPEISIGTIISILATLLISVCGAVGVYLLFVVRQDKNLTMLTYQVTQLAAEITALKDIVKIQTEQNMRTSLLEQDKHHQSERITRLERVIEEMQHGEHFVLPIKPRAGHTPLADT